MLHQDATDAGDAGEDLKGIERTLVASIALMRRGRREIARSRRRTERRRPEEVEAARTAG
jgi:hypothetical protein